MGGSGSGKRWSSRDTTNDYLRMDVRYMERQGHLRNTTIGSLYWTRRGERFASIRFCSEEDGIVLSYKSREHGGEWEVLEYPIRLERTRCNYGGMQTWFLCPARGCGRRVATLFGGRIYACRRCYGLSYLSQRESQSDRATGRAERILKRLGWDDLLTILTRLLIARRVCTSEHTEDWRLSMGRHDMKHLHMDRQVPLLCTSHSTCFRKPDFVGMVKA